MFCQFLAILIINLKPLLKLRMLEHLNHSCRVENRAWTDKPIFCVSKHYQSGNHSLHIHTDITLCALWKQKYSIFTIRSHSPPFTFGFKSVKDSNYFDTLWCGSFNLWHYWHISFSLLHQKNKISIKVGNRPGFISAKISL